MSMNIAGFDSSVIETQLANNLSEHPSQEGHNMQLAFRTGHAESCMLEFPCCFSVLMNTLHADHVLRVVFLTADSVQCHTCEVVVSAVRTSSLTEDKMHMQLDRAWKVEGVWCAIESLLFLVLKSCL